ncbi:MAG TPA: DUF3108 domain-containing protein [Geminicoccaceae bacterium]|nr:DUF3108 domain-containing protein [Geminicoccus sp.]HMU51566.1 DUF3108 domain-containing protein [Geminicoccaceae bacterium]
MAAALVAPSLHADTAPPSAHAPLDLRYGMTYAGMHTADLALTMQPASGRTRSELVVRTEGLVGWLSGSFTRMRASSTAGTPVQPRAFSAQYSKRDRDRETSLRWDGNGRLTEATEARNGRTKPSEVPEADREGAIDPLTAVLRLRDWLAAGPDRGAELRLPVTDGRKRLDMVATRRGDVREGGRELHSLEVQLLPVFGFEPGDALVSWPGAPKLYEVLVSGDGRYAPLEVRENGAPLVTVSRDCLSRPGCEAIEKKE